MEGRATFCSNLSVCATVSKWKISIQAFAGMGNGNHKGKRENIPTMSGQHRQGTISVDGSRLSDSCCPACSTKSSKRVFASSRPSWAPVSLSRSSAWWGLFRRALSSSRRSPSPRALWLGLKRRGCRFLSHLLRLTVLVDMVKKSTRSLVYSRW